MSESVVDLPSSMLSTDAASLPDVTQVASTQLLVPSPAQRYPWLMTVSTVILGAIIAFLAFRWSLSILIRIALKDRVKVRKFGSSGISGLQFRQHGFKDGSTPRGLSLRIQRISLRFNGFRKAPSDEETSTDTMKKVPPTWFTLQIQGVGVQLGKRVEEEGEKEPGEVRQGTSTVKSNAKRSSGPVSALKALFLRSAYAVPLLRPLLYLAASSLPAFSRILSAEFQRVELYVEDQDVVMRVAKLHVGVSVIMKVMKGDLDSVKSRGPIAKHPSMRRTSIDESNLGDPTRGRSIGSIIQGVQSRVGSSARGVFLLLASGLPEGRATTVLEWKGVQCFNAGSSTLTGVVDPDGWAVPPTTDSSEPLTWSHEWESWEIREHAQAGTFAEPFTTSWPKGRGTHVQIHPSNRVMFAPLASYLQVDTALGPNFFHLKAHRAFSATLSLSETIVSLSAMSRIRGSDPVQVNAQKSESPANISDPGAPTRAALAAIDGISLHLDKVRFFWDTYQRGHASQVESVLINLNAGLGSTSPNDPQCKKWLNTITVPTKSDTSGGGTGSQLQDRITRPSSPMTRSLTPKKKDTRVEPRRIFHISGSFSSIDLSLRSSSSTRVYRPMVLREMRFDAISTFTSVGLCPSIRYSLCSGADAIVLQHSTPNDSSIYSNMSFGSLDLDISQSFVHHLQNHVLVQRESNPEVKPKGKGKGKEVTARLPQVNFFLVLPSIEARYRLSDTEKPNTIRMTIPRASLSVQSEFCEGFSKRPESIRRSAWKVFDKNALEWPRELSTSSGVRKGSAPSLLRRLSYAHNTGEDARAANEHTASDQSLSSGPSDASGRVVTHVYKTAVDIALNGIKCEILSQGSTGNDRTLTLLECKRIEVQSNGSLDAESTYNPMPAKVYLKHKRLKNSIVLERLIVDLEGYEKWRVLEMLTLKPSSKQEEQQSHSPLGGSLLDRLPKTLSSHLSIIDVHVKVATVDRKRDPRSEAGVVLTCKSFAFDYAHQTRTVNSTHFGWANRGALELEEDASFSANALTAKHSRAAAMKIWLDDLVVHPIHPAAAKKTSKGVHDGQGLILQVPRSKLKLLIHPDSSFAKAEGHHYAPDKISLSLEHSDAITINVDVAYTYLLLLAASCFVRKQDHHEEAKKPDSHRASSINLNLEIYFQQLHIPIALPGGVSLFVGIKRVQIQHSPKFDLFAKFETLTGAARVQDGHVDTPEAFSEVLTLREWSVELSRAGAKSAPTLSVRGDTATANIPFSFRLHDVINGTSLAVKSTKQLVHDTLRSQNGFAIHPSKMEPPRLPRINLRLRMLVFEAEDDPFENRLGLILRAGKEEVRSRLERDAAFAQRVSSHAMRERRLDEDDQIIGSRESLSASRASFTVLAIAEDAKKRLDAFNASAWARRISKARAAQEQREDVITTQIYGRLGRGSKAHNWPVTMRARPSVAPLFRSSMSDLNLTISQPSFGVEASRQFIDGFGEPIPEGLDFSVFIPFHFSWEMSEWRWNLRDYPLPLVHVPPARKGEGPAWSTSFDMCIAEQMGGVESLRHVPVCILHDISPKSGGSNYVIGVPKVAMPTKIFGRPVINIHAIDPVRFAWGQSIQPTISDMVRVFDGFSSPPQDPSPKIGFWDKIPLIMHGTVRIRFVESNGSLHFYLKGSRDPYKTEDHAAGWVKCWRDNVTVRLNEENAHGEVLQISAREYILAIPDLDGIEAHSPQDLASARPRESFSTNGSGDAAKEQPGRHLNPNLQKAVLRLLGDVCWGVGILQERTCDEMTCMQKPKCEGIPFYRRCRFFDRTSHWKVITRSREYIDAHPEIPSRDSYSGWRHDHLHCSIAVRSGHQRVLKDGDNTFNCIHVTPLTSAHFWAWLALFNSALSLPIRQGSAFPDSPSGSPKFGYHMATMKYRFDLSPLFLTHVYLQPSAEKYQKAAASYLGLKARVDHFNIDLHQRQQEIFIQRKELGDTKKTLHKPIYEAEVDLREFELRVVGAEMRDYLEDLSISQDWEDAPSSLEKFLEKATSDVEGDPWCDLNDFIEIGLNIGRNAGKRSARVRTATVLECPRFNFHRKLRSRKDFEDEARQASETENLEPIHDEPSRLSLGHTKFGQEDSHTCFIGTSESPNKVQCRLVKSRIDELAALIADTEGSPKNLYESIEFLKSHSELLRKFDAQYSHYAHLASSDPTLEASSSTNDPPGQPEPKIEKAVQELLHEWHLFNNRYLVHNPVMQLSDGTRDILLKYYLSNRARRGFAHHMTSKAVRLIRGLDLRSQHTSSDNSSDVSHGSSDCSSGNISDSSSSSAHESEPVSPEDDKGLGLLRTLLKDTMQYVTSDRNDKADEETILLNAPVTADPHAGIRSDFEVRKSTICVLLKPQIVLRSDVDDTSCVIVSASRSRITNFSVRDPFLREQDEINEKVMNRNYFFFDQIQTWHPTNALESQASALPLEVLLDDSRKHAAFSRIMPRTDAAIQYDKFNKLRLHDSTHQCTAQMKEMPFAQEHLLHNMDLIRIQCPKFLIRAGSDQYAALYNVVTDLLLYRDPAYRNHAKRLETMLFAYNFRDAESLADSVTMLQMRIRQIQDLHQQYERNYDDLNDAGKVDAAAVYGELLDLHQELALFMEAISVAQEDRSGSDREKKSALRLEASAEDVTWLMTTEDSEQTLAELSIRGTSFTWLNKADNSTANSLSIIDLHARNERQDALFHDIIAKYTKVHDHFMVKQGRFMNAAWSVLAPVGGIAIIDRFELNVHPIKVQIEISVGREIMQYIFGTKRKRQQQPHKQIENTSGDTSPKSRASMESQSEARGQQRQTLLKTTLQKAHESSETVDAAGLDRRDRSARPSAEITTVARARNVDGSRKGSGASYTFGRDKVAKRDPKNGGTQDHGADVPHDLVHSIALRHASEMRKRAASNKTFIYVKVPQTVFCLSYKGDKSKSLTDLYDLVFRAPAFEYRNRTWAYEDLANSFKRDVLRAAWGQKTTLLKGFLTSRPRKISAKLALRDKIRKQGAASMTGISAAEDRYASSVGMDFDNVEEVDEAEEVLDDEDDDDSGENQDQGEGSNGPDSPRLSLEKAQEDSNQSRTQTGNKSRKGLRGFLGR